MVVIFMGVSGSGKSTLGRRFADETGATFYEGDDFHPPANVEKMHRGEPLTDADRQGWLESLGEIVARSLKQDEFAVVTCSALKASYREKLNSAGDARVHFVFITASKALLEERLSHRTGHFMPATLLDSQLATLEVPKEALTISAEDEVEKNVGKVCEALGVGRKLGEKTT